MRYFNGVSCPPNTSKHQNLLFGLSSNTICSGEKVAKEKKNDNEPLQEPTGIFWGKRLKDDDMHTLQ